MYGKIIVLDGRVWFFLVMLFSGSLLAGYEQQCIVAQSLDELVIAGVQHVSEQGVPFSARAGSGLQAYNVTYVLLNPCNRLHCLRNRKAIRYFCRELVAYFKGSLHVEEGLSQASKFWKTLANQSGKICSNYGYYVFHEVAPNPSGLTQYEWVIESLMRNFDSRKAFININQPWHKNRETKDFPCTIGMQFFIKDWQLCCVVSSRSTDVFTGLPYDMGFFALVTELVYQDLRERLKQEIGNKLRLGYVAMKTNFTQIYDKSSEAARKLLAKRIVPTQVDCMPAIDNAQEFLQDIYKNRSTTNLMTWIYKHAELEQ